MDNLAWAVAGLGLVGSILNIKKQRLCFLMWGLVNTFWVVYDIQKVMYAQAAVNVVNFVLIFWGWDEWRDKRDT